MIKIYKIQSPTKFVLLALLAIGVGFSSLIGAHSGATGVVKERMKMMDDIGKDMKEIKTIIRGKEDIDSAEISNRADSIRVKARMIEKMFPHNSLQEPTEALPNIWDDWDRFSELSERLGDEAKKLQTVAAGGNRREIMGQFAKVGKTCRGCHTDFRQKKEE
jgi:cytochrome c556